MSSFSIEEWFSLKNNYNLIWRGDIKYSLKEEYTVYHYEFIKNFKDSSYSNFIVIKSFNNSEWSIRSTIKRINSPLTTGFNSNDTAILTHLHFNSNSLDDIIFFVEYEERSFLRKCKTM